MLVKKGEWPGFVAKQATINAEIHSFL